MRAKLRLIKENHLAENTMKRPTLFRSHSAQFKVEKDMRAIVHLDDHNVNKRRDI